MSTIIKYSLTISLLLGVGGCSASSSDDENLAATPTELDYELPVDEAQKGGATAIPADAVTDWQKFFKASPQAADRDLLAKRILQWKDADSAASLLEKGRAEMALGQLKAAETSFRQALRLEATSLEASLELAGIYIKRREIGRAFEFLAAVRSEMASRDDISQSFIYRYRYVLALGYLARQDREKGHDLLRDLIAQDQTFTPAYAALASSYLAQDKPEIAEFVVQRGLDNGTPSASLFNLMAVLAMRNDNLTAAKNWIDKALAAAPTYAPALVNRAHLAMKNVEYEAAELDLKQALVFDPGSTQALVALGLTLRHQGRLEDAKATFEKAIDVEPENAEARYNLAILMVENFKRPHVAARLFHEVTLSAPRASRLYSMAERYLHQLEQHNERL